MGAALQDTPLTTAWVALVACTAFSLLLVYRGWRGRRIDSDPLCRKCGYDLVGLPTDVGQRICPECGADLLRRRAITNGHRARRKGQIFAGAALLAPCLAVLGFVTWAWLHETDLQARKPVWWLVNDTRSADAAHRRDAFMELNRRRTSKLLARSQLKSLAQRALSIQADPTRRWDTDWGDWIEAVYSSGNLAPDQWERYWRQMWTWRLSVRPRVRRGDPILVWVALASPRMGSRTTVNFVALPEISEWRLSGARCEKILVQRVNETQGWSPNGERIGVHIKPDDAMLRRLSDGPQSMGCTLELAVWDLRTALPSTGAHPISVRTSVELVEAPWVLLPASESSVALVTTPDTAEPMGRAFQVIQRNSGPDELVFDLTVNDPPLHVSGSIVLRLDDQEWPMGTLLVPKGHTVTRRLTRTLWPGDPAVLARSAKLDVVVHPDPHPATLSVDILAIWGRDIVIPVKPRPPAKVEEAALTSPAR